MMVFSKRVGDTRKTDTVGPNERALRWDPISQNKKRNLLELNFLRYAIHSFSKMYKKDYVFL